jgi:hypothetical protein
MKAISINRAPVLTLWAAVVAERLGFSEDEALTLGKSLAGLNAQSKGRRLGLFNPAEEKTHQAREKSHGQEIWIELCGRGIPARKTPSGVRAVHGGQVISPESVRLYLTHKFKDDLDEVRSAMRRLAGTFPPNELAVCAFSLYEKFRPAIPDGASGWGAAGVLNLAVIEGLVRT